MTGPGERSIRRSRPWAVVVLVVAGSLLVALATGRPAEDGPPLDPASTAPDGTRGVVDLLRGLGAEVRVERGAPGDDVATALVLEDRMGDAERAAVSRWVRAGGTVVVTDPRSPLLAGEAPAVAGVFLAGERTIELDDPECPIAALAGARRLAVDRLAVFERPGGAVTACFGEGDDAFLLAWPEGGGTIVALGSPGAFVNRRLGDADNAVLAAALLAPSPESVVHVARPPLPGEGEGGLVDVVPDRAWLVLVQLVVVFAVVAAWRARRLGRPVVEPQLVRLEGSELVVASGRLLHRARARGKAAAVLREELRRDLTARLGLPRSLPAAGVARLAAARTGIAEERLAAALTGGEPAGEDALVALAQEIESVRQEVVRAR